MVVKKEKYITKNALTPEEQKIVLEALNRTKVSVEEMLSFLPDHAGWARVFINAAKRSADNGPTSNFLC